MNAWSAIIWLLLLTVTERLVDSASIANQAENPNDSKLNEPAVAIGNQTNDKNSNTADDREKASSQSADKKNSKTISKKNDAGWKYDTDQEKHQEDQYRKFSGIRYTPLDLAEYILRTRDEEGVALAIEELLREGLIDREEAILYLENVKRELGNLKEQYNAEHQQQPQKKLHVLKTDKLASSRSFKNKLMENRKVPSDKRISENSELSKPNKVINDAQQALPDSRENVLTPTVAKVTATAAPHNNTEKMRLSGAPRMHISGVSNDKAVKKEIKKGSKKDSKTKENASDSLYEEYLLENVIYELAKDMFSQSMARDDASAEQLLSRFASFLETELADKKFSKEAQEKILDTVSAALIESLRERLYLQN